MRWRLFEAAHCGERIPLRFRLIFRRMIGVDGHSRWPVTARVRWFTLNQVLTQGEDHLQDEQASKA
jgi:hypothetical protein